MINPSPAGEDFIRLDFALMSTTFTLPESTM